MDEKKYRVISTIEKTIGDTKYIVENCVPENCTDEQIQQQTYERVKRLILRDCENMIRDKKTI